jgi:hypothetical protein
MLLLACCLSQTPPEKASHKVLERVCLAPFINPLPSLLFCCSRRKVPLATTAPTDQMRDTVMAEKSRKEGDSNMESFECGTSLAEREHAAGHRPQKAPETLSGASASIQGLRLVLASDVLSSQGVIDTFTSPFEVPSSFAKKDGNKFLTVPLVYCDHTASSRPVKSIEKYMEKTCLPLYGNTHTNTSITGSQSTAFVAEARQIVAESTNAKITGKASLDVVLFAGSELPPQ